MSQKKQILYHLLCGYKLTPLIALDDFECLSLSQRIGDLIKDGFKIERERKYIHNADLTINKIVGEYFILRSNAKECTALAKKLGYI